jgi:Yip1 domain
MGRGRDDHSAQQRPGGRPAPPPYPGNRQHPGQYPGPNAQPWQGGGHRPPMPPGEPDYYGHRPGAGAPGPYAGHGGPPGPHAYPPPPGGQPGQHGHPGQHGQPGHAGRPGRPGHGTADYDDNPGSTRAFTLGDAPYGDGGDGYDDGNVGVYRAGQATAPPSGPRLHWKELLSGIVLRPQETFWRMRDYPVWGPAVLVTFVYGLLAVFGFEQARHDILSSSTSTSVPWVVMSAVAMVLGALVLGAVTNALARQLGGDGAWAPTIGLSMLIMSLTDAPRLLFAIFLPSGNALVQVLGWLTWLGGGALLTSMVSRSHDLPWPRALGACSIQLVALLVLLKLPTLGG